MKFEVSEIPSSSNEELTKSLATTKEKQMHFLYRQSNAVYDGFLLVFF